VAGGFISHAPELFTGGLFGGETVQTSTDPNQSGGAHSSGDTSHEGGGDACDFFLQHMWKNEDGIPVIGTNSHFLTYHTDPSYRNLPLSLTSGAIGNSQMPIIDIYGGPLGWIPIFNPSHVRGHGTDYVTLLTGCGGMGLPVNPKNGSVDLNKIPTPEKVTTFAGKIFPSVPSVSKITGPDSLYNTLQTKEIMSRVGPTSVMTPDEYLSFAGKNFDAFRLLWQTALSQVSSGNPTAVLDVLKVTNNIQTLQSLGMPGLPGSEGPTLTSGLPGGSSLPLPGSDQPSGDQPSGDQPSGDQPSSDNPLGGLLGGGSNPLGGLTGGGSLPLPGAEQPSDDQPSDDQPSGDQPSGDQPSGDQPSGDQPSDDQPSSDHPLGGLLGGGSDPLGGLTGGLTGGGTLPLPGAEQPSDGDQPAPEQPSDEQPSGDQPSDDQPDPGQPGSGQPTGGSDAPSSDPLSTVTGALGGLTGGLPGGMTLPGGTLPLPSGNQPSGQQPGSTQPSQPDQPAQQGNLSFKVGAPGINGQAAGRAPGASVAPGSTMTVQVPVTNNGTAPITDVKAQVPGDQGLTDMACSNAAIQPGATSVCKVRVPAQSGNVKMSMNIIATSADGQQMTKLCNVYYDAQQKAPKVAFTGKVLFNGQSVQAASQSPISTTEPSTLTFEVTNKGNAAITSLNGTSTMGKVTCASQRIEPGQTTTCTATFTPKQGENAMTIKVTGRDQAGTGSSAWFRFCYSANAFTANTAANSSASVPAAH
jgi:hypothetical protein